MGPADHASRLSGTSTPVMMLSNSPRGILGGLLRLPLVLAAVGPAHDDAQTGSGEREPPRYVVPVARVTACAELAVVPATATKRAADACRPQALDSRTPVRPHTNAWQ